MKAGGCGHWAARCALWGFVGLMLLITASMILPRGVMSILAQLPFGWLGFLERVFPRITTNGDLIGMALVCLMGFLGGSHWFLRWIYRYRRGMTGGENVGESKAGEAEAVVEAGDWKLAWTAAINGLLWLSFFIGMSFIGVVHQVGWMAASDEPRVVMRRGGYQPRHVALNIQIYFIERDVKDRAGLEEAILEAQKPEMMGHFARGDQPKEFRAFLLVDSDFSIQGCIVFRSSYSGQYGSMAYVLDSRDKSSSPNRDRHELPALMRRYQDELHLLF